MHFWFSFRGLQKNSQELSEEIQKDFNAFQDISVDLRGFQGASEEFAGIEKDEHEDLRTVCGSSKGV